MKFQLIIKMAIALISTILLGSCSLDDDRDLCCDPQTGVVMDYRYMYLDRDVFPTYIKFTDHYLFDEWGNFIRMVPPGRNPQRQYLDVGSGMYHLVTVGNVSDPVELFGHAEEGMEKFLLRVKSQEELEGTRAKHSFRAGELYGGFCQFRVEDREDTQYFRTDMSNIHCQLDIRVEFDGYIPEKGEYRFELDNVPNHYAMDYARIWNTYDHDFPADHGLRDRYSVTVPLVFLELEATFVTLRYSNECVPTLRLWLGDKAVTPLMDLERAFQRWGWVPDEQTVQEYRILVTIRRDGSAVLKPWVDGEVLDWVDGGVF